MGSFGLGERNERGDRLIEFATEEQLVVTNTFYDLPPRRLYTWKSPQDTPDHTVRNQIDYILINKRFRNSITSVKAYPGSDINSDHNPLIAKMKLSLKKVQRPKIMKYDINQLKNKTVKEKVQKRLKEKTWARTEKPWARTETDNTDVELENLHKVSQEITEKYLKPERTNKKEWMTEEILCMMEDRRNAKDNKNYYNNINNEIKRAIKIAKENWFSSKCTEIESLQQKHDSFNLHKKIKEAAGLYKHKNTGFLTDNQGNIVLEIEHKRDIWIKYVEKTFEDIRSNTGITTNTNCESGPPFTVEEVKYAIKSTKDGKAVGPDNFHSEFLKLMDYDGIKWLTNIFNSIYDTGVVPQEWLVSTFINLPKKPNARKCEDYRIISLMSHLLKTFLKVIHKRIYTKCEEQLTRTQFGFRDALGTREALFAVQVLFQRCRDVNCDIYVCFIDYQKAFDRVKHDKLMTLMQEIGIDNKDLRIIRNIYYNQTAKIKIEDQLTDKIAIERGVRQGCILSPLLFNIYSEWVFKEALDGCAKGILINGEWLNNIRYADDTIVFADNLNDLQILTNRITEVSNRYGLALNIKKTKFMTISKKPILNAQLTINQQNIERVEQYTYLGTNLNSQWDHSTEIKQRIIKAKAAFVRMRTIFNSRDISLKTKCRLLNCYIFTVLLYGMEAWTLTVASMNRLEAFEMWCYRRILRISWVDRVTNVEVLRRMGKECEILMTVKTKKLEYLGHVMRNQERYGLLQLILQGKVNGKRGPGRRRISWLQNLRKWYNTTTTELFRAAINKVKIAVMIANIRNG